MFNNFKLIFSTGILNYIQASSKKFYNQLKKKDEELKSVMKRCDLLASENPGTHKEIEVLKKTIKQKDKELSEKEKEILVIIRKR